MKPNNTMTAKQFQLEYGSTEETREQQVSRYFAGTKKNTGLNKNGKPLSEKAGVQSPLVSWYREVVEPLFLDKPIKPILIVNPFADMSYAPSEWFQEINNLQYPEEKAIYWKRIKAHNSKIMNEAKANGFEKSNPDVILIYNNGEYTGLCMELKKLGEKLQKRNGEYKNEHTRSQAMRLKEFRANGFKAEFVIGFKAAKSMVCEYLEIDEF